ncbi:hypothetical protein VNO77_17556 [Canavalia gladiata]|uniref:Uncharacterized protein n=1 Tax=Canavalia gladiata TaxID=3824 RepID=A0AAN9LJ48_CANGL
MVKRIYWQRFQKKLRFWGVDPNSRSKPTASEHYKWKQKRRLHQSKSANEEVRPQIPSNSLAYWASTFYDALALSFGGIEPFSFMLFLFPHFQFSRETNSPFPPPRAP